MTAKVLALDAMGVLYRAGDDVAELLVPFVVEHGGETNAKIIEERHLDTSLGRLSAASFWTTLGLPHTVEDAYLSRHRLRDEVLTFLSQTPFSEVCCISNDVAEWSQKLRTRHALDQRISRWFISGDLGHRKPDAAIYRIAIEALGVSPEQILFVDDRCKNLEAAGQIGMQTAWLSAVPDPRMPHRRIVTLNEL